MIPVMDAAEFYDSRHIKNLLPRIGPCLSIYLPLHMDGETHSTLGRRLRNALQQAQSMLTGPCPAGQQYCRVLIFGNMRNTQRQPDIQDRSQYLIRRAIPRLCS